jgi:hypothetical protein
MPPLPVLPAAPLRLLQDLAHRQSQSDDLSLPLPSPVALSNLSPLPLPIHLLLVLGIFDLPPDLPGVSALEGAISTSRSHDVDIPSLAQGASSESSRGAKTSTETIEVPTETLRKLQTASVDLGGIEVFGEQGEGRGRRGLEEKHEHGRRGEGV